VSGKLRIDLVIIESVCDFARLFAKLLRPRDSEGTFSFFESSCYLLLPA